MLRSAELVDPVFVALQGAMKGYFFDEAAIAQANPVERAAKVAVFMRSKPGLLSYQPYPSDPSIHPGWRQYIEASPDSNMGAYAEREDAWPYRDGTFPPQSFLAEETMVFYATSGPLERCYFIPPQKPSPHHSFLTLQFAGRELTVKRGQLGTVNYQVLNPVWQDAYSTDPKTHVAKHSGGWIPLGRAIELKLTDATLPPR